MRSLVFLIFAKNNKGIFNLPYDIIQNIMMPHIYFKNERCTLMSIFEYFFMKRTEIIVVGNCYMQERGSYKSVTDDRNWE